MRCAEAERVQAYFDGELDALSAQEIERHCESCPACRTLLNDLTRMRTALRQELTYASTPPELRARITRALDDERAVPDARAEVPRLRRRRPGPFWSAVVSGIGGTAIGAMVVFFLLAPTLNQPLLDELVSTHVNSLLPDRLIEVASTDKHTVKPWFAGHADVSPVLADFVQQGYRLVGGRADYLQQQRAAVVVYQHGAHVINVFSWATTRAALPQNTTRNGYHLSFWRMGNVAYCAVSDTDWRELDGLVRLLQDLGEQDNRP